MPLQSQRRREKVPWKWEELPQKHLEKARKGKMNRRRKTAQFQRRKKAEIQGMTP